MDLDFRVGLAEDTVGLAYKCKLQIATLHWGVSTRAARQERIRTRTIRVRTCNSRKVVPSRNPELY